MQKHSHLGIGEINRSRRKLSLSPRENEKNYPIFDEQDTVSLITQKLSEKENPEEEGQLCLDVIQTQDEIMIISPIAGVKKEDIELILTDETLTIQGKRRFPVNTDSQQFDFLAKECFWGNFSRHIVLPKSIDKANIQAQFKNNVLILIIPKLEAIKTKVIKIN